MPDLVSQILATLDLFWRNQNERRGLPVSWAVGSGGGLGRRLARPRGEFETRLAGHGGGGPTSPLSGFSPHRIREFVW